MATYAIGDVQGCFAELQALLQKIHYQPEQDQLWFAGDLVNRGPDSLTVLRFVKALEPKPIITLGNHDLHLLAVFYGAEPLKKKDTFQAVLQAKEAKELCAWLKQQKLFHYDEKLGYALAHAGIAPQWSLQQTLNYAHEVEAILASKEHLNFFKHMYGDQPDLWDENLKNWKRLRLITNYLTRMRFCDTDGRLNLSHKKGLDSQPENYLPWFKVPNRAAQHTKILFGHWAALNGKTDTDNVFALDTGCVWGGQLTAMRLEDGKRFQQQRLA